MNNPESHLGKLNKKLLRLINYVSLLDIGNQEDLVNLKKIYRKTCISQFLFDKYVISITGMQGVGKTTFIKQLYKLKENEILPENLGTGEQIPILITESDISGFKTEIYKLELKNNEISLEKTEVSKEDFMKVSKNPKDVDIFLELTVPYKYFSNSDISFLLLPGFDEYNEKDYWQFLTKYSLINSANFIYVLNESTNAKGINKKYMDEFFVDFSDSKPLFVLSKSDESKDNNKGLSEIIFKDRKLDENEKDRIICTGTTEKFKNIWIPQFKKSIEKYKSTSLKSQKVKLEYLSKVLDSELFIIIDTIQDKINTLNTKEELEFEKKLSRIITPLKESIGKIRKEYEKEIKEELSVYIVKPIEKMTEFISEKDWKKKLKNFIFGMSAKDNWDFGKELEESWNNANDYSTEDVLFNVYSNISSKQSLLLIGKRPIDKVKDLNSEDKKALVEYDDKIIDKDMLTNLDMLFNKDNKDILNLSKNEFNKSLLITIKLIPALIIENIRLTKLLPKSTETLLSDDPKRNINSMIDEFNFTTSSHSKVISAFGVILGIDGAADGKIDSIPNLLNALGIQLSARAAQILSAGIAVAGVGMLVRSMIITINKNDIDKIANAKHSLNIMKENAINYYMNSYDETMDYFVEYITNRIRDSYYINNSYARKINIDKILADLKEIRLNIKESINENIKILGN